MNEYFMLGVVFGSFLSTMSWLFYILVFLWKKK